MSVKTALKAEASNEGARSFTFNGEVYDIPSPDDWTVDVVEAYEEGKIVSAIKAILGPKQWRKYKDKEKPLASDLKDFVEAMFEEAGVDSGE